MRVPVYRKMFEAGFFLSLLFLYYTVLVERSPRSIGRFEILMDIWIVAFAYDELSGLVDAGVLFYQMDFWSLWNLGIIGVGFAFIVTSKTQIIIMPLRESSYFTYKDTHLGLHRLTSKLQGASVYLKMMTTSSTCHSTFSP